MPKKELKSKIDPEEKELFNEVIRQTTPPDIKKELIDNIKSGRIKGTINKDGTVVID